MLNGCKVNHDFPHIPTPIAAIYTPIADFPFIHAKNH